MSRRDAGQERLYCDVRHSYVADEISVSSSRAVLVDVGLQVGTLLQARNRGTAEDDIVASLDGQAVPKYNRQRSNSGMDLRFGYLDKHKHDMHGLCIALQSS
ncbi:hypothetical protein F503_02377 [Ophiostoma piceae UAMH 11346]|uniref:Uncharacterized protein n=1 Tax=Ophiostoma piceae (strain UAMH 11346) TaxID=1262450 RepID=S3BYE9_OPHP1|nr:hypothetical protein F503_02377 [Ophiostoma piceae UAMH 11346]